MPEIRIQVYGSDGETLRWRSTLFAPSGKSEKPSETDGSVVLLLGPEDLPAGVYVSPREPWHWSLAYVPLTGDVELECPRLPDGPVGWWHHIMGVTIDQQLGEGIRIGVVDSPFEAVGLDGRVSLVRQEDQPAIGPADPLAHGAKVCSVLVGDASGPFGYPGLVRSAKIFHASAEDRDGIPRPGSVATAIRMLAMDEKVDLINLSLGDSAVPSIAIHNAIQDAFDFGTLVLAAAGNSGEIMYPACYPECVAVGAIGIRGFAPNGTIPAIERVSREGPFTSDKLYICDFSPISGVDIVAPGSGVIFDVNGLGPFDLFGTSFACPMAAGALAAVLGNDETYRTLARDADRAAYARDVLWQMCEPMGLPRNRGGRGVPRIKGSRKRPMMV